MRPTRRPLLLACLAVAPLLLLSACAGQSKPAAGEVVRTDPIAQREREGYELARRAAAAQNAGNPEQAIDLYRQAVSVWPEIPSAWNNLGLLLMDQSNFMDAVEAFKTAARQNTSDPRPLVNVGIAYDRTGWADEALAAYIQALDRRPLDHDALIGAVAANHRLLGADRPALERTKTALLVERDPEVRVWLERERFRIEGRLRTQSEDAPAIPLVTRPTPSPVTPPN